MKSVAVLGGGPAGASAAERLARAGLKSDKPIDVFKVRSRDKDKSEAR